MMIFAISFEAFCSLTPIRDSLPNRHSSTRSSIVKHETITITTTTTITTTITITIAISISISITITITIAISISITVFKLSGKN